jgi:hypothetical protein
MSNYLKCFLGAFKRLFLLKFHIAVAISVFDVYGMIDYGSYALEIPVSLFLAPFEIIFLSRDKQVVVIKHVIVIPQNRLLCCD